MSAALAPLGALYGGVAAARAAAYRRGWLPRARLAGPVISVGNLSVGGSGKTHVVALIAEMLRHARRPVSVLSRGYGGSFRGDCLVVGDGQGVCAGPEEAGDEPVMLARALPGVVVAVGRRRDRVGRAVEARFGARVHVLDDGRRNRDHGRHRQPDPGDDDGAYLGVATPFEAVANRDRERAEEGSCERAEEDGRHVLGSRRGRIEDAHGEDHLRAPGRRLG